jgi:hypothetical protein
MLRLDDLAADLDLEALFGVPDLTGRLAPFPVPGPDDGPVLRAGPFEQQLPAGVERVAGPPLKRKGRHERAARLQVITEAAQRARRGARAGDGGRLCAVIDFGNAGVGDPAADVIAAWSVFSHTGRETFRNALGVDDGTWSRARGFALHQAAMIIPYYPKTNPGFVALAKRTVEEVLADNSA